MYFENIKGQEFAKKYMINSINKGKINHAYMFEGIEGIGKETFAYDLAKILLETPHLENAPDCIRVKPEGNSIKIAQIRNLQSDIVIKPHKKYKIYIIDKAEKMTLEAQNALLKTLEEPPEYAIIILITSNENLLLNTIKSRCIRIPFSRLTDNELKEYFDRTGQTINVDMIKAFGGSIEKALKIKDKQEIYQRIQDTFNNLENLNELQILNIKDTISSDKDEIYYVLDYINTIFLSKIVNDISNTQKYEKCIEIIEETKQRLKRNSNYDMTIDNCLFALERSLKING